jgi:hypothetical protein
LGLRPACAPNSASSIRASPCSSGTGGLNPASIARRTENWVLAQNFRTRIKLMGNRRRVTNASRSKARPVRQPSA